MTSLFLETPRSAHHPHGVSMEGQEDLMSNHQLRSSSGKREAVLAWTIGFRYLQAFDRRFFGKEGRNLHFTPD